MRLKLSKAGTSDALTLNGISKRAFDSDVEIGPPAEGAPISISLSNALFDIPFNVKASEVPALDNFNLIKDP